MKKQLKLDKGILKALSMISGSMHDYRLLIQGYRAGTMHDILPADVLWGSFVTHSFLPHAGEMNA